MEFVKEMNSKHWDDVRWAEVIPDRGMYGQEIYYVLSLVQFYPHSLTRTKQRYSKGFDCGDLAYYLKKINKKWKARDLSAYGCLK